MPHPWIASRSEAFDSSGIRQVFDLAAKLENPINLSIGQPDFDVPEPVRKACIDAIESQKNGYAVSQGMPVLREKLQAQIEEEYGNADRELFITSGTSGGLVLTMLALVNPGDEVILFDPYFLLYDSLVRLVEGVPVILDTYPNFQIDVNRVAEAITDRTKLIIFNSPGNPTGVVAGKKEVEDLALLAREKNIALLSDEIYRQFCYDGSFTSPASFNDKTIVINGFSKSHAMTGWRVGYVHGPAEVIDTMIKLQQYTFVCAPQPMQWAGAVAMDVDTTPWVDTYHKKRDRIIKGLEDFYAFTPPGGAFYLFPKAPGNSGSDFATRAIEKNLLIIPGKTFSARDTHFRISYAADDETIDRGIEALREIAH